MNVGRSALRIYGGSGLRGVIGDAGGERGAGVGSGLSIEQPLSLRNRLSFAEASLDWRMTGSLQGRGMSFLLMWAYSAHLNRTWWRVCRWERDGVEQGQVVMSSAPGLKRAEYSASKQCPVASCGMAEVTMRECAVRLPLMASTGLPLSGVWQARAEG